jgi:hypothetical protein
MTAIDWTGLARDYGDIAMIVRFEPAGASDTQHVCLVMKDGGQTPWFAAGKGIEGAAWTDVPGRVAMPRLLADARLRQPGVRVYANYCDARALIFRYDDDVERIAGEELVDAPYGMLYPDAADRPPLEEFYLLWGEPE